MQEWAPKDTLIVEAAKGSHLVDTDGRKYLDGVSSLWCNVHGHRVPEIDKALSDQLRRVAHSTFLGLSNVPAVLLAEKLIKLAPPASPAGRRGLTKVFYSDSGSEAVEIALKMAYQYWKHRGKPRKKMFLNLSNSYHGDTIGSVSVGGIGLFHGIFKPLLFKTFRVKGPDRYHEKFRGSDAEYAQTCAARVESVLKAHAGETAAVIMEPLIQGAAGMITHPKGFLKRVRRLCDRTDVLLILDEVATGFGRTGKMFACENEGVSPDILCLAKGLTGGYLPLAATLTRESVYKAFLGKYTEFKAFFHGHTYTANPLACAAALASLRIFETKKVLKKVNTLARFLSAELERFRGLSSVGDVRQCGLMAGIELEGLPAGTGAKICFRARKYGVIIRPLGNVIVLMPPFSFSRQELVKLCDAIFRSIKEVASRESPVASKRKIK